MYSQEKTDSKAAGEKPLPLRKNGESARLLEARHLFGMYIYMYKKRKNNNQYEILSCQQAGFMISYYIIMLFYSHKKNTRGAAAVFRQAGFGPV